MSTAFRQQAYGPRRRVHRLGGRVRIDNEHVEKSIVRRALQPRDDARREPHRSIPDGGALHRPVDVAAAAIVALT